MDLTVEILNKSEDDTVDFKDFTNLIKYEDLWI